MLRMNQQRQAELQQQQQRARRSGYEATNWDDPFALQAGSSSSSRSSLNAYHSLSAVNKQFQPIVEVPTAAMDRSSALSASPHSQHNSPLGSGHSFGLGLGLGHGQGPLHTVSEAAANGHIPNIRLSRSSSMQRHIPAQSLRMAPTPLRPQRVEASSASPHLSPLSAFPGSPQVSFIPPAQVQSQQQAEAIPRTVPSNAGALPEYGFTVNSNLGTGLSGLSGSPKPPHTYISGNGSGEFSQQQQQNAFQGSSASIPIRFPSPAHTHTPKL